MRKILVLLILVLVGCSTAQEEQAQPIVTEPPAGQISLADFKARLDTRAKKFTIEQVFNDLQPSDPSAQPLSFSDIGIEHDGVPGTGQAQTCELVTTAVYPGSPVWSADVDLRHFMQRPLAYQADTATRSINNAFIQISSVTCDPSPCNGSHDANNSDPEAFGLDATHGLWEYTAPGAAQLGVLGSSPDNAGSRTWSFNNPDDATVTYQIRVVASLSYASYSDFSFSDVDPQTFVDACATGSYTVLNTMTWSPSFPLTLFGRTLDMAGTGGQLKSYRNGVLGFAGSNGPTPNNSCAPAGRGVFAFWDDITFNAGTGRMCHEERGTAPDRKVVVSWQHMKFTGGTGADDLNFSVILTEGSNTVDLVYQTMTSANQAARATGTSATVGVSNGATCVSPWCVCNDPGSTFGSGNAYQLSPIP